MSGIGLVPSRGYNRRDQNDEGLDDNSLVYVRFEGGHVVGNTIAIPSVDIVIPKAALDMEGTQGSAAHVQPTYLGSLAKDTWRQDVSKGASVNNPLTIHPLRAPCSEEWSPKIAHMIAEVYQRRIQYSEIQYHENPVDLRPRLLKGVELEEALVVLDYYGFNVMDDPKNSIILDDADPIAKIRGGLFLQEIEHVESAKQFIVKYLTESPARITYFLFADHTLDMNYVNFTLDGFRDLDYNRDGIQFVRLGESSTSAVSGGGGGDGNDSGGSFRMPECDRHYAWVQGEPRRRENLVALLEEVGLTATFVFESFPIIENCQNHEYGPQYEPPKHGYSLLARKCNDSDLITFEDYAVLKVLVPPALKKARRIL